MAPRINRLEAVPPPEIAMNIGRPLRIYENVPANPKPIPEPRPVPEPAQTEPVEPATEP